MATLEELKEEEALLTRLAGWHGNIASALGRENEMSSDFQDRLEVVRELIAEQEQADHGGWEDH